ncbi:hypothetical protein FI667_g11610, partial [Globisporangium splendens]
MSSCCSWFCMRSAVVLALAFVLPVLVVAWDQQPDGYEIIDGPTSQQSFDTWRQEWEVWKKMELRANRYEGNGVCDVYNLPATQWTQNNFVQVLLMLNDRAIYDREKNEYTVDKYVDAMEARVGKIDSVLIWSSYPNIGIDNRNQWDLIRTLPGGITGVKKLVNQFQKRGIRVIITYNPWDTATRDENGLESTVRMYNADIVMLNRMITEIQADGFNGDTMYGVPKSFYNCSNPLVATPEGGVPTAFLGNNPISWGYFLGYSNFPPVSRAKFLEPRHMVQVCARWSQNKMVELQAAFFNGIGYVLWENVWGIWNAMTEREDEATKRIFTVLRKFSFAITSAAWRPYSHGSRDVNLYVSEFPAVESGGWFYTVISASDRTTTFRLPLSAPQSGSGVRIYDVYHGKELTKHKDHQELSNTTSSDLFVQIELEPYGFGAIFVANGNFAIDDLDGFLREMQLMTKTRLADFSMQRPLLKQEMIGSDENSTMKRKDDEIEDHHDRYELAFIRGAKNWWFNVTGVQIEPVVTWTPNWLEFGTGVQFPWEHRPWNNHSVQLTIQDFQIGKYPVTNLEYARFLSSSKYKPKSLERFLEHWENRVDPQSGDFKPLKDWRVPKHLEKSPVVYVAREDAEAFAHFYGLRLPHDWEWQYVVSNGENYTLYPWGDDLDDGSRLHKVSREKNPPLADAVGSHSASRSLAFEVEDLVGYVWQMTDQFCDLHTCSQLLRGGSFYQPVASTLSDPNWYFPQALAANQHNRFLMISESYDRSALVSFRCAKSAPKYLF